MTPLWTCVVFVAGTTLAVTVACLLASGASNAHEARVLAQRREEAEWWAWVREQMRQAERDAERDRLREEVLMDEAEVYAGINWN